MSGIGGSMSSSNNSDATSKRRKTVPKNRTDIGWKHGTDVRGDGKIVECNHCSEIVRGGIFRFKHHLAATIEDSEAPEEVKALVMKILAEDEIEQDEEENQEMEMEMDSSQDEIEQDDEENQEMDSSRRKGKGVLKFVTKGRGGGVQPTKNHMMKKDLKVLADQQVAEFFYTSGIPFDCIKNVEFAKMCEMIGRYGIGYEPPSYHDIRGKLLKQAVTRTDAMLEEFREEWKITGCSIMCDVWTDKEKQRSICNISANSPKGTIYLYSADISDISKTTENVFKILDVIVTFVGEENVVQVVTDNAANYKAAGEMLMQKRKNLYWTPCATHCIDLILADFEKNLKLHQITIERGRKITNYIYSRTMLISMLKKFTKGKDLIRPGLTRFAATYLTLSCLNDNKASLMRMFSSNDWKSSKFASTQDGRKVENMALDSRLWKNIIICLKAVAPLMGVLRLVDSDEKPAMGFIYEKMDAAKEKIKSNFNNVKKSYEPIWKIIEERWDNQLYRPLHAAAYYLNPHFHYEPNFRNNDVEVKLGLFNCMERLVDDLTERNKMHLQLLDFHFARGIFGLDFAKFHRKTMLPTDWWDLCGDRCPELQRFATRILSLTCSSSRYERDWSSFEMVHTKGKYCLHQKKMNDLVYVMHNLKLKSKQIRRNLVLPFDDIHSDNEWITEEGDVSNVNEENVQQPLGVDNDNVDQDSNVEFIGSPSIPTSNNLENWVLDANIEEPFSSEEELDDDDDNDGNAIEDVGGLDF